MRYKEEEGIVPISLTSPPNPQIVLFELQNVQDEFLSRKHEEIGLTCHISESGAWQKPPIAKRNQRRTKENPV